VLNDIRAHDWTDFDQFSVDFTDEIVKQFGKGNFDIEKIFDSVKGSFLSLNSITKKQFLSDVIKAGILKAWNKAFLYSVPFISFLDIFPSLQQITDQVALPNIDKLKKIEEEVEQEQFRLALRELGATAIARRGKDSALEISDLEHFHMIVKGRDSTFSAVVKGYKSLPGKLNLEGIAHQIWKAYTTRPDYILLISAKEPVDGLVTQLNQYSNNVGNSNLIVFMPPLDLVKFLMWRKLF
jgi:hypothetical protein